MASIAITGSNRGLGLEWVKQYAQLDWRVYATCRKPEEADELHLIQKDHNNVSIHQLDVTSEEDIHLLATDLIDTPIDLLINNAGVYFERWGQDQLGTINYADWEESYRVNTLGPARVTEALRKHIASSDRQLVVSITSHMGSIAEITAPNDYAYRSSKAALNATMKGMSAELAFLNIGVLLLHPGWVRTRMGGSGAPLSPEESVSGMRNLVENFTNDMSGCFYRYDGVEIPW